ncbi:MAG: hypothetical protein GSR84_00635 [Desulfurococcales archaeon]|nr:hypothetical protein [Desulfurococcales archaeon]
MKHVKVFIGIMMTLLMLISMMPVSTYAADRGGDVGIQAISSASTYSPSHYEGGVLQADRLDYMNAADNPLAQDIANNVFQGPGIITNNPTVGYMKDIYLNITHMGTLAYFNYTGEGYYFNWSGNMTWSGDRPLGHTTYRWLNIFDPDSQATHEARSLPWNGEPVTWEPLEGWAIAYTIEAGDYATDPDDAGYLVVTYSGFDNADPLYDLKPNVIGHDSDDNWSITVAAFEKWVDNPRLVVYHVKVVATNYGHFTGPDANIYRPTFNIHTLIIFNKATKFIEVWTKAYLASVDNLAGKANVEFQFQLSRMAILDSNPACDWSLYGWKFVNLTYNATVDPWAFITLSYINESLTNTTDYWGSSWDYYAAYMLAYPVNSTAMDDGTSFSYAITSVIPTTFTRLSPAPAPAYWVWHAPFITTTFGPAYAALDMAENPGLKPMGDQALIRYEWYKAGAVPGHNLTDRDADGMYVDWKLTMYGVYDVAPKYWGGEAGPFTGGIVYLSNDTMITPPGKFIHNGTLGYLNGIINVTQLIAVEDFLEKNVTALDLNRNGTIEINFTDPEIDEFNLTRAWLPTEELLWQLYWKFAPPTFNKLPESCFCNDTIKWDFSVTGAPGRVTDSLGSTWLNARFTAQLVLFDVDVADGTGNLPPIPNKMAPFLMLTLTPIASGEDYTARKAHYLTPDGRAFVQMHFNDTTTTPWRDVHFLAITVAGPRPNLATYYFNDFATLVFPLGGDYPGTLVLLPYGGPKSYAPYLGSTGSSLGLGVIAITRDHFNNYGLIVYGLDAQDTYWTAWYLYNNWATILSTHGNAQSLLIFINYTTGSVFPAGTDVPIADPNFPSINGAPAISIAACSTDYKANWILTIP